MEKSDLIFVAGHNGLVGSAICWALERKNYTNLFTASHKELDLKDQAAVKKWFSEQKIKYVFLAAAKVGGILANNTFPAQFIYDNLMIQSNVIHAAYHTDVKKLEFLGSSCVYPKFAPQPIKEDSLLTGPLEPTNEAYAIAKIAGIKMCQYYTKEYNFPTISLMPTNLYGPNDNFDLQTSHVLPALLRKFHEAKINNMPSVTLWGTGTPLREFLYIEDMGDAAVYLMEHYDNPEIINVGTGKDLSIKELASLIREITSYKGELAFDASKPDGTPRKLLNISKLTNAGWNSQYSLQKGIELTYTWFKDHYSQIIENEKKSINKM